MKQSEILSKVIQRLPKPSDWDNPIIMVPYTERWIDNSIDLITNEPNFDTVETIHSYEFRKSACGEYWEPTFKEGRVFNEELKNLFKTP